MAEHCDYKMPGGRALRLGQTWEVAVREIAPFVSFHLGKYQLEVAALEKAFGKLANIYLNNVFTCAPMNNNVMNKYFSREKKNN